MLKMETFLETIGLSKLKKVLEQMKEMYLEKILKKCI